MVETRALLGMGIIVTAVACVDTPRVLAMTCPDPTWRAAYSTDSSVALCLPPDFRATGARPAWRRGEPTDSAFAIVTVGVLDSTEATTLWGATRQPRRLRDPVATTALHALRAESVLVRHQMIDGQNVEVESARVSGGNGLLGQPYLRATWRRHDGASWVLLQGWVSDPRDLELLRQMAGTVRVWPTKDRSAAP